MIGCFASSLAGHDKGKIYLIVDEKDDYVFLSDGSIKKMGSPKKKKRKHIQLTNVTCEKSLYDKLLNKETVCDDELKRAIKVYRRSICQNLM